MVIALTHYGNKEKPTLVQMNNVNDMYQVFDKVRRKFSTKICYTNGEFKNVVENLEEIYNIIRDHEKGKYQDVTSLGTPAVIDEQLEESYQESYQRVERRPYFRPRETNYNNAGSFNRNQF